MLPIEIYSYINKGGASGVGVLTLLLYGQPRTVGIMNFTQEF